MLSGSFISVFCRFCSGSMERPLDMHLMISSGGAGPSLLLSIMHSWIVVSSGEIPLLLMNSLTVSGIDADVESGTSMRVVLLFLFVIMGSI